MKILTLLLVSFALLLLWQEKGSCQNDQSKISPSQDTNNDVFQMLVSKEWRSRLDATEQLDRKREEMIQYLLKIVAGTNTAEVKANSIVVLGEYRAVEAVPFLLKLLGEEPNHGGIIQPSRESSEVRFNPVSGALQKIGMPAIPALIEKIKETDDPKMIMKCVSICEKIEGADVMQFRLQRTIKNETDAQKKVRLELAVKSVASPTQSR